MDLRQMITDAAVICGSQNELAKQLKIANQHLTNAKAGLRGIPDHSCGELGKILGIDPWLVICARNLVTEKNPEKRNFFLDFLEKVTPDFVLRIWVVLCLAAGMTFGNNAEAFVNYKLTNGDFVAGKSTTYNVESTGVYIIRNFETIVATAGILVLCQHHANKRIYETGNVNHSCDQGSMQACCSPA